MNLICCAGVEAVECDKEPKNDEGRLRKQLFCGGYDKESRPITIKGPITIKFKMIIKGFNFDDNSGKLTVSTWLGMVRSCAEFDNHTGVD